MKHLLIYLSLIVLITSKNTFPHFIYDGIESFKECVQDKEHISFTIYGTLTENIDPEKMKVDDYEIKDMGVFKCSLLENKNTSNEKRKHKIFCSIKGVFERKGYIMVEPRVYGFDFKKENGETSWPEEPEQKTFLIPKCGERIEIDNEPLLFLGDSNYVNPLETVRKGIVDQALSSLPSRASTNKGAMCEAMANAKKKFSLSDGESAYLAYKWLGENIVYDCYALNHGGIDHSEDGTYYKGKGVCSGYAMIYVTLGYALGLETEYVVGYSKGAGFVPGVIPYSSDHAWNSVKIGNSYYLVDPTWGAGSCDGDNYKKNFRDFYFCPDPEAFIRTHLPEQQKWQLVSQPITLKEFVNMLKINEAFYENGFKSVSPDAASFSAEGGFKVSLTYDESITNMALLSNLYLLQGNTYMGQNNACFYIKGKGKAEITCITNYKGEYMIKIFGGPGGSQSYPELLEYNIESTKNADVPMGFPTVYGLYSNSDTQLIEPLYNPLTKGALYKFKVISTTFDNLHLIIGDGSHYHELDKGSNGEFTAEDVYIHGSKVALCTLVNNQYNFILQYTTVNDPNSTEEPTFPQGYAAPKNVLYSPLTDTLKRGYTYTFKIKCDSVNDMVVVDGNNFVHLEKNGDIFSGQVTINGSSGQVNLASYTGRSYSTFYLYRTSR